MGTVKTLWSKESDKEMERDGERAMCLRSKSSAPWLAHDRHSASPVAGGVGSPGG